MKKLLSVVFLAALIPAYSPAATAIDEFHSGLASYQSGNWVDAIAHLETAVKMDPRFWEAYNLLAYSYGQVKDFPKAVQYCDLSLQIHPENPSLKAFKEKLSEKLPAKVEESEEKVGAAPEGDQAQEIEDLKESLGAIGPKLNNMDTEKKTGPVIFGEVRFRYLFQSQLQSDSAAPPPGIITDKAVGRYRVRLGVKETVGDVTGVARIATGTTSNPNGEFNTLDNGFGNPAINVDQANLTYEPGFMDGLVKARGTVGKMKNPFFSPPMSWDPDINPEGAMVEVSAADTRFRSAYFDLANNNVGKLQNLNGAGVINTGYGSDEFMINVQLDQTLRFGADTSLMILAGYEYIPYATALAGGAFAPSYIGPQQNILTFNNPNSAGNILDYGKTLPDFKVGEVAFQLRHKLGDIPVQWTVHLENNFNSFNVPFKETDTLNGPSGPVSLGYTTLSNKFGGYLEFTLGDTKKDDFLLSLAACYLEPNAQLANLTSDDGNFTNTQYLFEQVGFGMGERTFLLLSVWELQRIYYAYINGGSPNNFLLVSSSGFGTSRSPEFQAFAEFALNF